MSALNETIASQYADLNLKSCHVHLTVLDLEHPVSVMDADEIIAHVEVLRKHMDVLRRITTALRGNAVTLRRLAAAKRTTKVAA